MPQENYPYTVTTPDSVYIIKSDDDFFFLADSIKQLVPVELLPGANKPYEISPEFLLGALILFVLIVYKAIQAKGQFEEESAAQREEESQQTVEAYVPHCLIYKGDDLEFDTEEVRGICTRYNPFFNKLNEREQNVFINRLGQFMFSKDFYIISSKGYKEMPVLISAAAIQISFGLDEYLFPYFSRIIIHPEEYIAWDPIRILVGNVQGRSITLSWKHFLEDYQNPADGKNVGLHEMAHALQVQHLFKSHGYQSEFKDGYEHYDKIDDEVLFAERSKSSKLFDENALSNPNEFWATSVELFFEKPLQLNEQYPRLYKSISLVLNLDTAAM